MKQNGKQLLYFAWLCDIMAIMFLHSSVFLNVYVCCGHFIWNNQKWHCRIRTMLVVSFVTYLSCWLKWSQTRNHNHRTKRTMHTSRIVTRICCYTWVELITISKVPYKVFGTILLPMPYILENFCCKTSHAKPDARMTNYWFKLVSKFDSTCCWLCM